MTEANIFFLIKTPLGGLLKTKTKGLFKMSVVATDYEVEFELYESK